MINGIKSTKAKPKLNDFYKIKEEKLKEYRKQNRTLENRQLSRANLTFKKRLKSQKSSLRIREMDKFYRDNHLKMVDRSRKIKQLRNIILPPISTIVNRIKSPKKLFTQNNEYNKSYSRSVSKDAESSHQYRNLLGSKKSIY